MPVLYIGRLVALHATRKFYGYLRELEKIENYVRKGDTIFESYDTAEVDNFEDLSVAFNLATSDTETKHLETEVIDDEMETDSTQIESDLDPDNQMEMNDSEDENVPLDSTLPQTGRLSKLSNV